ncbi:MAG TPA: hypothetical protein VH081_06670 [Solirubrobacteraceae bacterium]|nr:hypothetical protein [Solirubrobacteraceae bacterium]
MDRCIFCGELFSPQRKRSEEHAAPQWCGELLAEHLPPPPPDAPTPEHFWILETADGREEVFRGTRDPFTTVAKDVCVPCNTGWMEELEDWAKQWLAAPVIGKGRALRFWRQACAASWAVKTALVWELVEAEHRTVPLDVLRIFHQLQRPGGRQQVWLGHYQGSQPHHSFRRTAAHLISSPPQGTENPQDAHGYLLAVTIGQLAMVTFGHTLAVPLASYSPGDALPGIPLHEQFPGKLIQIWPLTNEAVRWPPPAIIDDATLDLIARSLGQPMPEAGK